jgi:chromosome segregation ATPase
MMSRNKNKSKQPIQNKPVNKTEGIQVAKPISNVDKDDAIKIKTEMDNYYLSEKEKKDKDLQEYYQEMTSIFDEHKNAEISKLKQELISQNQAILDEYKKKISMIEEEKTILSKQQYTLNEELLNIEAKKRNIETEIQEKFGKDIKSLTSTIDDLINQNKDLHLKLSDKDRKLVSLENDRLFYEEEVENLLKLKQEITKLNIDVQTRKEENLIFKDRFDECNRELIRLKARLDEIGGEPLKAIEENKTLKNKVNLLSDELAQYPSIYEIESLRKSLEIKQKLEYEKEVWSKERIDYVSQLTELSHYKEEIENQRRFIKIIELQKLNLKVN